MRSLALVAVAALACDGAAPARRPAVRFMHTLSAPEAAALDRVIRERALAVDPVLLPFARGEGVVRSTLAAGQACPDLLRIDATWLPGLAAHLAPPPPSLAARDWLPPARALATVDGRLAAAPMSLDGLVLVRAASRPRPTPWPPTALTDLATMARAETGPDRHGLGVRIDGYWLVPFLRARGADVADGARASLGIDGPGAEAALADFAALFSTGVAAPAPPPGAEAEREAARFRAGELATLVTGPWAFPAIAESAEGEVSGLAIAALPHAPIGAQLLAVPRCAPSPEAAWALVEVLTEPAVAAAWARRIGTVPTTVAALADAGPLAGATYAALAEARPLPRHPLSTALFDDLTPAVAAVVAGDATPAEAIAGVRRAWARALERNGAER